MSGDRIESSTVGQVAIQPSALQEQYFSMCLARQADTQSKMGLTNSPETAQRTVDQCKTVSELQLYGSIAPPVQKAEAGGNDLIRQAAEHEEAATIKAINQELLKGTEKR